MTRASRRTGRAAALSVAVTVAAALLASACSAPPAGQAGHASAAGAASGSTAPLPGGTLDRGIHVPGTLPNDRLDASPVALDHAPVTHHASSAHRSGKHPRTAHPRHACTRRRVWADPHHRSPNWHRLHTAGHPTTAAATAPRTTPAGKPAPAPATKPALASQAAPASNAAAPAGAAAGVQPAIQPATDRQPRWIGTPAEHVPPLGSGTQSTPAAGDGNGAGPVVIPVTVPAGEGPLRPDTVISGPGYQIDLRQRPASPAPGTMAPLNR